MGCPECDNCDGCDELVLESGKDGQNQYLYVAYADDDQGNGFTTNPNNNKKWRSEVQRTSPATNDKSLHDSEGKWIKYIGDDGTNNNSSLIIYNDDSTKSTSQTAYTKLKTYTIPANTVDSDGDVIRVKTSLRSPSDEEVYMQLLLWDSSGTNTFYTSKIDQFFLTQNDIEGILDLQINREGGDGVSIYTLYTRSGGEQYQVTGSQSFFDRQSEVQSPIQFANDINIEVQVKTVSGSNTVYNDHLSVEHIRKS